MDLPKLSMQIIEIPGRIPKLRSLSRITLWLHFFKGTEATNKTIWGTIEDWCAYLATQMGDNSKTSKTQLQLARKITLASL